MPQAKAPFKSLSIKMQDSVVRAKKKYYPQTLLEESSSDGFDNEADNDSNDETESDNDNDESNE